MSCEKGRITTMTMMWRMKSIIIIWIFSLLKSSCVAFTIHLGNGNDAKRSSCFPRLDQREFGHLARCPSRYPGGYSERCPAFRKTTRHELSSIDLPFFASPSSSSGGGGGGGGNSPQSATVTLRLPMGTLFDGRDYTFVTYSNVRGYEWTVKEVDVLLDDLVDAALGRLYSDGKHDSMHESHSSSEQEEGEHGDYELSQIVLVPTADWDSAALGLGNRYDVHDGQQRLVTLSLLLASLRDSFLVEARHTKGGKRAVALAATAQEIASMLLPAKVRKADVRRIQLRGRDDFVLSRILSPTHLHDDSNDYSDDDSDQDQDKDVSDSNDELTVTEHLSNKYQLPKTKQSLSKTNLRILSNHLHLFHRLSSSYSTRERLRLLDYIIERLYLLVCVPETSRIARNIVMAQGKGMDNEPIDDFKGLVCFRYTSNEKDMYQTFDQWDILASEPQHTNQNHNNDNDDDVDNYPSISSVGRDIITSACLLRASSSLRVKLRSRGGDQVYDWERWLRRILLERRQSKGHEFYEGKDFFNEEIAPASIMQYRFKNGLLYDGVNESSTTAATNIDNSVIMTSRLNFLRHITSISSSLKEIEMVILEWLLHPPHQLNSWLGVLEQVALYMALERPSPMIRHRIAFAILDNAASQDNENDDTNDDDNMNVGNYITGYDQWRDDGQWTNYDYGANANGRKLATAILLRLEDYLQQDAPSLLSEETSNVNLAVETIIANIKNNNKEKENDNDKNVLSKQSFPIEEYEEYQHRLGNLALVSKTMTKRQRQQKQRIFGFNEESYAKEPFELTKELQGLEEWTMEDLKERNVRIATLMDQVWPY